MFDGTPLSGSCIIVARLIPNCTQLQYDGCRWWSRTYTPFQNSLCFRFMFILLMLLFFCVSFCFPYPYLFWYVAYLDRFDSRFHVQIMLLTSTFLVYLTAVLFVAKIKLTFLFIWSLTLLLCYQYCSFWRRNKECCVSSYKKWSCINISSY